jgi:ABC-type Mn2+/Zn2+ transport system permease subunit
LALIDTMIFEMIAITLATATATSAVRATLPLALLVAPTASALLRTRTVVPATLLAATQGPATIATIAALSGSRFFFPHSPRTSSQGVVRQQDAAHKIAAE